ncbi:KaiC domain-containing protein [Candidatus Geothermarchaeota archaeon]|nr:MAG: KaiC domain-containing protein [Candidatus Geothermarchaeota archaeon]
MRESERRREYEVVSLHEIKGRAPKIFGIPSGVEGLDSLFFTVEIRNGEVKKIPLGGYPYLSVMNLTGIADTGKSLMAEQFAVKQASLGYRVCFVTVETPKEFIVQSLRYRASAMGISIENIDKNIFIIDCATNQGLRENLNDLLDTLAYAIREYGIKSVVIDSVTGLYEAKEVMARVIVRKVYNFMKKWRQTCLMVSQKRSSSEELTAEAAGGYGVAHIVDGTIVLYKKLIQSKFDVSTYGLPLGSIIRLMRIDGCRMTGHDTRTFIFEITDTGLVRIMAPLNEYIKRVGGKLR